jgi:hypothetical protein
MNNKYYASIKDFQAKITRYATEILKVYGNELQLKLEDYNLLAHDKNCLESSTAFGYIIEEFLVSKLGIYSANHTVPEYVIQRPDGSTTTSSYDCYSMVTGIKVLVNIKADKQTTDKQTTDKQTNNAIAAIKKLHSDYVKQTPKQVKAYLVFKVHYHIAISERDKKRKIFIDKTSSFFLEEIDFSRGHHQDRRSWSAKYNANSGRLQATPAFRCNNKVEEQNISYEYTKMMLQDMFTNNH